MDAHRHDLLRLVRQVQELPYTWPGPWDAAATRAAGRGTCAGKHALLAELLREVGLTSSPLIVVGPLVPDLWPDLQAEGADLLEVHECLTVETAWNGPLLVDVTWHPAAVRAGLPGTLDWSGRDDMQSAVQLTAAYAVDRDRLRYQKLALRRRLYRGDQELRRERLLAAIAARAASLEAADPARAATGAPL